MENLILYIEEIIDKMILSALVTATAEGKLEGEISDKFSIEIPADTKNGDFSSNVAMVNAKNFGKNPREIAQLIVDAFPEEMPKEIENVQIAGPGFLNFYLTDSWFSKTVETVLAKKEDFGRSELGKGQKVLVEFVSANPTGPMHLGNARGGVLGDSFASCLEFSGHKTQREFYINDAGNQIINLGKSLEARYLEHFSLQNEEDFPEDGYKGEDIKEHAEEFISENGDKLLSLSPEERRKALADYVVPKNIAKMKIDLEKYGITYDTWFSEQSLYDSGDVEKMEKILRDNPHTYEKDGALWFKSSDFGAEKDDVLIRENGLPTYYLVDIAYHYNKFIDRGFDRCIDVWGADHHGHVKRMKDGISAVGIDGGKFEVMLMQLVHLLRGGESVRMSKRKGQVITLDNLLEEVSVDAARFYFNSSAPSSHLDFDLGLAVEENSANPVYYVQYAHARICSIFKNFSAQGIELGEISSAQLDLLVHPAERELIRFIAQFTNEVIHVTNSLDPSKITKYTYELATKFHKFYDKCRIKDQEENLLQARLGLAKATAITLQNALKLLKVSAPEVM